MYSLTLPVNGHGVYRAWAEVPRADDPEAEPRYREYFIDPGSGNVNGVAADEEGLTSWLYRGHMYLWQDHGLFEVFDPASGWCRCDADGHEPGGVRGVVCDVIPDGEDMVAWFGLGWIVVLLTGFYLWYWPGLRRWATAFVIKRGRGRFALHMSVHKVVGFVVWAPLLAIAFTGVAFAFPNMKAWYQNATPAQRGFQLWAADDAAMASGDAAGRVVGVGQPWLRPVDAGGRRRQHVGPGRPSARAPSATTARPRTATCATRRGTTGRSRSTPAT